MALLIEEQSFLPSSLSSAADSPSAGPWTAILDTLNPLWKQLQEGRQGGSHAFFALPFSTAELGKSLEWATRIQNQAKRLVLLGIGGSALGSDMLIRALGDPEKGLPVTIYDNIDPQFLSSLEKVNWQETFLLVVSKSGETVETLSQLLTVLPRMQRELGPRFSDHIAVITEKAESSLGQIAEKLAIPRIAHPPVGGRFSVLSVVGLLPAAVAGVDITSLLTGAANMARRCQLPLVENNPALRMAAAQYVLAQQGKTVSIALAYGERLGKLTAWLAQLMGESLGKRKNSGQRHGLTPVAARGVTDQHSQLQLYLDGPADKQFTLLFDPTLEQQGQTIPAEFTTLPTVAGLAGHTTGALFAAEFRGTRETLIRQDLPVRTLNLPSGDAAALGEWIILLEMETVIMAALMGINPFDQPAVEQSKILARLYLEQKQG